MIKSVRLCKLEEVPMNGALGFDPFEQGRDTIFVVNTPSGLFAYKDLCPHYGNTSLPWRKDTYLNISATKIVCAAHGAEFEINTGMCVSGPCLGQSLIDVPIQISEDGFVLASIKNNGEYP